MIWVILIYILVIAVLSMQLGKVGDIYGRGRMFNLGFAIFTVASFLCGIALTDTQLIAARALQAIGGALLQSTSSAIIADTFRRERVGRAFGFTAIGYSVGAMLGIILGGVITTFLGYRYVFFINVPIGIVAVVLGLKYLRSAKTVEHKIDMPGMLLLGISISALVYSGIMFSVTGMTERVVGLSLLGLVFLGLFLFNERRTKHPTIDFDAFANKVFRNSLIAAFLQSLGYIGSVFMLIMYLQGIKGFTPLYASLLLVPSYIMVMLLAPYMGKRSDIHGARGLATGGIALMILGILVYFYMVSTSASVYIVLLGSLITGIGSAMFWPANTSAVMANSKQGGFGATSGLLRLFGNIGLVGSFVIVIVAAASAIPRSVAFQIFVGSSRLTAAESAGFVKGMQAALLALIFILVLAALASATRGREERNGAGSRGASGARYVSGTPVPE
jgi:MFS family permease